MALFRMPITQDKPGSRPTGVVRSGICAAVLLAAIDMREQVRIVPMETASTECEPFDNSLFSVTLSAHHG